MLPTYIKNIPHTKFILIEDTASTKADPFINYLINHHRNISSNLNITYCEFEFSRALRTSGVIHKVDCKDFIGSLSGNIDSRCLLDVAEKEGVIIVNSLAHMAVEFGLHKTYQLLNEICAKKCVQQLIGVLHSDLLTENDDALKFFHHLSTLHIVLSTDTLMDVPRVAYTYRKPGGKVLTDVEQYSFSQGNLVTRPLEKLDAKKLVHEQVQVAPETLSTFKIALDERDMMSRENFVLPYVPQESQGEIYYEVDAVDDWDEEDPDDDLDI